MRESDEFAKLNKILVRRNVNERSKPPTVLLATEDLDAVRSVQLTISDVLSKVILDAYEPATTGTEISALEFTDEYYTQKPYLEYLDRILYLFNLIEVWSMSVEVIVLPVDSHSTTSY